MYGKLKEYRKTKGYSLEDMGKVIGKSSCIYFKKENGDVKFTLSEALAIAKFLNRKVENIFFTCELSKNESEKPS